jgi:hypothetical protein
MSGLICQYYGGGPLSCPAARRTEVSGVGYELLMVGEMCGTR